MRSADEVRRVLELARTGENSCAISRRTGIPRSTIVNWRQGRLPDHRRVRGCCLRCAGYRFPVPNATEYSYAYLLGLYLGDGHISHHPRGVYRLRISLDSSYPGVVAECCAAISLLAPVNKLAVVRRRGQRLAEPSAFSRHWLCLFPQHGRGFKHSRRIELRPWQREILDRYPWRFLRGLIHSDGSRFINTIKHAKKTYSYPRYNFTNRSDDIRALFCEYCDKVGVEWRRMNPWSISVARGDSVALMDRFIGPKR